MNAVVVVNIGNNEIFKISEKSIKKYCKKYNLKLHIISDLKYNIQGSNDYMYVIFEKNQIYDLFKYYDRILRLDNDILITPKCPNLFEIVPEDQIGAVREDIGSRKKKRIEYIKNIQKIFGDIKWNNGYFNSGVILVSKKHKEIFNITDEDIKYIMNWKGILPKEQTLLNYKIKKANFKVFPLNFKFNHMSMFSEPWNRCANKYESYIIHYAGPQHHKLKSIESDYKNLFKKYRFFNRLYYKISLKIRCSIYNLIRIFKSRRN